MIHLPESFEKRMKTILGIEFPEFLESLSSSVSHSIRINPRKTEKFPPFRRVSFCSTGYLPDLRPVYTLDPLFHNSTYYVQESSSMFLEQFMLLTNRKSLRVLDLCAAPGGKSTHLSSLLTEDSLLVSNEVIHSRALILSENLKKWGNPNVIVTCNDPRDFSRLPGFFDVIIVDAPCSGEGLFRRDGAAIDEWSESNADHCSQRQKRILADIWPSLAEGGMLIYSTCTYNPEENEENIAWLSGFAEVEAVSLQIPQEWGVVTTDAGGLPCYRFYPHKVKGEGFFIAAVLKKGTQEVKRSIKSKPSLPLANKTEQNLLNGVLLNQPLSLLKFESDILAWPTIRLSELDLVKSNLRIVHAGVKVGEIIRDGFNPAHELAISNICNISHFPQIELTLEQALSYLKRDDFQLNFSEKSWNLITYKSKPLGWAKNIGNRFNNGYPKEWRIRMSTSVYTGEKLFEEARKFPLI
jgi:16S rRNA C967 or C1407 C5-methylase (RsmB/RsmF family)/NOL1/NOP2/fmu family ribosome biogenesis protein